MFEEQAYDPRVFIETLREYHETGEGEGRGELASVLSELIIGKRINLAVVRQELLDTDEQGLINELDQLVDLIGPYLEEGGLNE